MKHAHILIFPKTKLVYTGEAGVDETGRVFAKRTWTEKLRCEACGSSLTGLFLNYCDNCGAKLDLGEKEGYGKPCLDTLE